MRTDRIISSIPKDSNDEKFSNEKKECPHMRSDGKSACSIANEQSDTNSVATSASNWIYPSPIMFWDAMNRKGSLPSHLSDPECPETREELEWIVTIHNVVNEQCWQEVCKWERFRTEGCKSTVNDLKSAKIENGIKSESYSTSDQNRKIFSAPVLQRFLGRPDDLSPRAWFKSNLLGYQRPFDRHDWYVRDDNKPTDPPRRYIIDFYAGNPNGSGAVSSFYLDVRPAMDTVDAVKLRINKYFCEKVAEIKDILNK